MHYDRSFLALFRCSKMNVIMIKITKFLKRRGKMKVGVVDITNPGIRCGNSFLSGNGTTEFLPEDPISIAVVATDSQ